MDDAPSPFIILGIVAAFVIALLLHIRHAPPAAELAALGLDERPFYLSQAKGTVVLLDFWAPWCKPCLEEMPGLLKLQARLKGENFSMVGVASEVDLPEVRTYVATHEMPFQVVHAERAPGYDHTGIPTMYLIDCKGRLRMHNTGGINPLDIESDIRRLLYNCTSTGFFDGLTLAPPSIF